MERSVIGKHGGECGEQPLFRVRCAAMAEMLWKVGVGSFRTRGEKCPGDTHPTGESCLSCRATGYTSEMFFFLQ